MLLGKTFFDSPKKSWSCTRRVTLILSPQTKLEMSAVTGVRRAPRLGVGRDHLCLLRSTGTPVPPCFPTWDPEEEQGDKAAALGVLEQLWDQDQLQPGFLYMKSL